MNLSKKNEHRNVNNYGKRRGEIAILDISGWDFKNQRKLKWTKLKGVLVGFSSKLVDTYEELRIFGTLKKLIF